MDLDEYTVSVYRPLQAPEVFDQPDACLPVLTFADESHLTIQALFDLLLT